MALDSSPKMPLRRISSLLVAGSVLAAASAALCSWACAIILRWLWQRWRASQQAAG